MLVLSFVERTAQKRARNRPIFPAHHRNDSQHSLGRPARKAAHLRPCKQSTYNPNAFSAAPIVTRSLHPNVAGKAQRLLALSLLALGLPKGRRAIAGLAVGATPAPCPPKTTPAPQLRRRPPKAPRPRWADLALPIDNPRNPRIIGASGTLSRQFCRD